MNSGQFKKGQHWRPPQDYWQKAWLEVEYLEKGRSAKEIATEQGCTENNILYWLHKHGIPRRTMVDVRKIKHWGLSGSVNGMFGRRGADVPSWKGGITPERQGFYASQEWAKAIRFVWKRDKGTCQRCGGKPRGKGSFHFHHRITFGVRELRANYQNLVLLCRKCHLWVHSRKNTKGELLGAFQATLLD